MSRETKSKFIMVHCKCEAEQVVFGNASTQVKCLNCGAVLAAPTGGKANIKTKILKVLE